MEKKKHQKNKKAPINSLFFIGIITCGFSLNLARADSWEIIQFVTVNDTNVTLKQTGRSRKSLQSLNHISTNTPIVKANQSVDLNNNELKLVQGSRVKNSTQSVNLITAQVEDALQRLSSVGDIVLLQNKGNNNTQSINAIISDKPTSSINQQVSAPSSRIAFRQRRRGSGNIQAGNYIEAPLVDKAIQSLTAKNIKYSQTGNNNIQAGNYLETSLVGESVQTLQANTVRFDQAGNSNLQAGNVLIVDDDSGNMVQSFSARNVDVDFSEVDENGSRMAANYIRYK